MRERFANLTKRDSCHARSLQRADGAQRAARGLSATRPSFNAVDADAWKWVLTLGGAGFELIGLGLVLLDARDARRRARDVKRRDQVVYVGSALSRAKGGEVTVKGGRQPTMEERVDRWSDDCARCTAS
jgi:hypothetical protein